MFNSKLRIENARLQSLVDILAKQLEYAQEAERKAASAVEKEREFWREEFSRFSDKMDAKMSLKEAGEQLVGEIETPAEKEAREKLEEIQKREFAAVREWLLGPQLYVNDEPIDQPLDLNSQPDIGA